MAKIYVAGNDLKRARVVMDMLIENGHTIAFDWVTDIENEKDPTGKARLEQEAVRNCDVLIYLWAANQESARFEAGMAMGLGKPVITVTLHKAFFFSLPEVTQISSDDKILDALKGLKYKHNN